VEELIAFPQNPDNLVKGKRQVGEEEMGREWKERER